MLKILETMWYAFSNTTERYIRRNKHSMLHYNYICNMHEIPQITKQYIYIYEGWNFNSGKYLFTTDTK